MSTGAPPEQQQDRRWSESVPDLVAAIRDEILAAPGARITFARFMERALTEPGAGYYATSRQRPTREGDFLTAPELHPFFGRCVARFVAGAWERAGSPDRYVVREYGAGRGTLGDAVLSGLLTEAAPLASRLEWQSVDLDHGPGEGSVDLIVANEYLDALPVHRLRQQGELREAWVGWRDGWFAEVLAEPSDTALAATLRASGVVLQEGQRAEVCLAAARWIGEVAPSLRQGGLLLVIDYGHEAPELYGPRRRAGSLLTYRHHEVGDDPFLAVGNSDITAHVDLSALRHASESTGLVSLGRTTQARFLVALGLGEMLAQLGRGTSTDLQAYLDARAAVARFLDPRHLGAFAVLAWERADEAEPHVEAAIDVLAGSASSATGSASSATASASSATGSASSAMTPVRPTLPGFDELPGMP